MTYDKTQKRANLSAVKVMRLLGKEIVFIKSLELMNPEFKSFYKRDPFEMLTFLISGLHDDLNRAPHRNQIVPVNSYPAFENQGIIELDYIQAEKWIRFFK